MFLRIPFALLNGIQSFFTRRGSPRSIVVIKSCCLGDLLMTMPLLDVLRRAYPQARIVYVAGSWSKVIPEYHPAVDAVIDCGNVGIPGRYGLRAYLQLAARLRSEHFDLAFVLDRSPMLTMLPWLAAVPRRVGLDSLGRGFSLTDRVPTSSSPDALQHQAEIYLDLARAIGLPIDTPHMRFVPTAGEKQAVQQQMQYYGKRRLVAIFPGGGSNPGMELTAKRWPLARYRELASRLVDELDAQVLLIGGVDDKELNAQLLAGLAVPEGQVVNLAGQTSIGELAAWLAHCDLFIGNDSSPMHLAAAVDIPVIAIFGPTSPQEYGPYPLDDPNHIALWRHPTGRPCFFLGKMQSCEDCTCMQSVTVDDVWQAVQRLIPHPQNKEVTP